MHNVDEYQSNLPLGKRVWDCGLLPSQSDYCTVTGSCEHCNEPPRPVKEEQFRD
jgi:hypothetical protein